MIVGWLGRWKIDIGGCSYVWALQISYSPYILPQSIVGLTTGNFYGLLLVGRLGLLQVPDCKVGCKYGEDYGLEFCGGKWIGSMTGKTETGSGVGSNHLKKDS